MSKSGPIIATDNNDKGWVVIDWSQAPDNSIRYDTNNKEEVWLEAKRVVTEKAKAKRAVQEAEEERAHKEEERHRAEEEKEAKQRCKAKAGASGSEAGGEVKKVVMDPSCTCCTWAKAICEFLVDGNKKWVACVWCNQSKGKCWWPGDSKDTKASPKARRVNKGKKWKADEEMPEPRPSKKKVKAVDKPLEVLDVDEDEAGGSRPRGPSGLSQTTWQAHETMAENSGRITNVLEVMLDESYSFWMAVSPSDLGSSELNSDKLCEEADWLKAHGEDEEEESSREDETMAKAE
ncbi:hypothetical protein M404DRAFT_33713 [Pisolithus tinctorius Marx 270]|uniref:Uncharacterized protein n=1 Tax=Pisolithus tinctorius Marx 270 TaxID=870435 RepID=A0A0C3NJZ1_PISTI|nr:hypothetical protein M404DRAFT_33713 [Pisolithus tinctorius Marx 270]